MCLTCSSKCVSCRNNTLLCEKCIDGYILIRGECLKNCSGACYYDNESGTCKSCSPHCLACSKLQCSLCANPYVLFNGSCILCDSTCKTCVPGTSTCLECAAGLVMTQNGFCAYQCPYGTANVSGICVCAVGYEYNRLCVPNCPPKTAPNSMRKCKNCSAYCIKCTSPQKCDEC